MDDQHKPEWIKVDEWDFVEYVDSLLRSQEAVDLEFKTARSGFPNSVWETYSSFANTDGGTIVLGIKEKNGALFVEGLLPEQIVSYRQVYPKLSSVLPKPPFGEWCEIGKYYHACRFT